MASRTWRISETSYPAIRRVMGSERAKHDDAYLEDMLAELFPGAAPEDVEDFMGTLQRGVRTAAPIAQRALPGMMQGAAQGASVAGPWGALAGALGGGAMSLLGGGQGSGGAAASPGAPAAALLPSPLGIPVAPVPSGFSSGGAAGSSNAAAAQLLALLLRPETMQALLSLLMGSSGRPAIAAGTSALAPAAFANAISELAAEAALQGAGGCSCHHGRGFDECADCSQASTREQATWLMTSLSEADGASAGEAFADSDDADLNDNEEDEEDVDTFESWADAYEAALEGNYVE